VASCCGYSNEHLCSIKGGELLDQLDDAAKSVLRVLCCRLISPHPNTYTYTKRLAEQLVSSQFPLLPVAIARPSIGVFQEQHNDTVCVW